jgi:hypothetical protein
MTTAEAAALWGISESRVKILLKAKRIPGAYRDISAPNADWVIPDGTPKPEPGRPGRPPRKE